MSDAAPVRTAEEIEAELAATREELTHAVNELAGRMQPEYLIEQTKESLGRSWSQAKECAARTVEEARDGDTEALKKVGFVALGAAAVIGLVLFRITRRH